MKILFSRPDPERLLQAFTYFADKPYADPAWMELNNELASLRGVFAARLVGSSSHEALDGKEVGRRVRTGFPLVNADTAPIDDALCSDLFGQLCDLLARFGTISESQATALRVLGQSPGSASGNRQSKIENRQSGSGSHFPSEMVRGILRLDVGWFSRSATATGTDALVLAFLAENLARPVVASIASAFPDSVEVVGYSTNTCPCCGHEPVFSIFQGDEGHRMLKCSLCHTNWEFSRTECPFCRNTAPGTIKFLCFDHEDAHRAYVCDACRRYIRSCDLRKCVNRTVVPEVEALATAYLDRMAVSKGYVRETQAHGRTRTDTD